MKTYNVSVKITFEDNYDIDVEDGETLDDNLVDAISADHYLLGDTGFDYKIIKKIEVLNED